MTDNKRGGPGRGQGRKPIAEGETTVTVSLRMTATQRDKLARLGGAEWVRQCIDKARAGAHLGTCIDATGWRNAHGYVHVRHDGKVVRAHRLAYAKAHGLTLDDIAGRIVRHACDNPACINPAHLVLVTNTHTDNMPRKKWWHLV